MANRLQDVYVIITGGSSGLGYAMAKALAREGAIVGLAARASFKLDEAVHRLKTDGYHVFAFPMDVRSEESIDESVKWVKEHWGKLDVLINNAGIGMRTVNPDFLSIPQQFYHVSPQGFRDIIETNLTGYFLVSKAFAPLLVSQRHGKVINISMNRETMKRKGFIPYGPSRAATESLTYIMAEDLKDDGIDVNLLLPGGATDTGMIPEEAKEKIQEKIPLLNPDIIGEPIVFLASQESNGITGERINASQFSEWIRDYKEKGSLNNN